MRIIISLLAAVMLVAASSGGYAYTDEHFQQDRLFAQQHLRPEHRQYCLNDFSQRIQAQSTPELAGQFRFNDHISRDVYDRLYWGEGKRGVAFTVPVRLKQPGGGETAANVACFYAVRDDDLVFQYSQQVSLSL